MSTDEHAMAAHPEVLALTPTSNPYLDFYRDFCATRKQELFDVFDPETPAKTRAKLFAALDVRVAMKYAWAIPDERALRIIKHYGPIVEMGAGNGYWGKLLQLRGVDIICYDLHVASDEDGENDDDVAQAATGESDADDAPASEQEQTASSADAHGEEDDGEEEANERESETEEQEDGDDDDHEGEDESEEDEEEVEVEQIYWTDVRKGTPKDLRKHSDRTLLLCYPDDFEDSSESMALESLCNYAGDTVIHVGELFGQTLCLPGAWGRTSAKEFQEHLASVYHKVLQVPLPSWHSSIDTLTVWKRTKTAMLGRAFYAFIPPDERLDLVEASASTHHLLSTEGDDGDDDVEGESDRKRMRR